MYLGKLDSRKKGESLRTRHVQMNKQKRNDPMNKLISKEKTVHNQSAENKRPQGISQTTTRLMSTRLFIAQKQN